MSTSVRATCTSTTGWPTQKVTNKLVYHFGTGTHHVVGKEQAENGSGNMVFGITASIEEYEAYVKLVAANSRVAKNYVAYFGDIYLTNPKLLPDFDVVTMVHLCEFFYPNTTSTEYGGIDDRGVLDLFTAKTKPGGHILFYTKSIGFEKAEADRREVGEGSPGHARRRVQDAGGVQEELRRHSRMAQFARTFCVIARSEATKQSSLSLPQMPRCLSARFARAGLLRA